MKVEIRDAEAVRKIHWLAAVNYLRARSWKEDPTAPKRAPLWHLTVDGEEYEVLMPTSKKIPDYALRMGDMLQVLAAAEQRSQLDIYQDLMAATAALATDDE